ncbi:hypothetical protein HHI36_018140 [Cryptolaemus montrouzieri]|uniref:Uncharacterized protein n=1 Tax=Cryptolaemus montrouzieri TaxID=559131 RepID=A0ABD2NZC5_9CUCU
MFLFIFVLILTMHILIIKWTRRKSDSLRCLIGKTAIVTGGNSGTGYGAAIILASRGCKVIIANRSNGEETVAEIIRKTQNPNVSYKYLDLSSLKSVRKFCEDIKNSEKKIDILINNAGIGASTQTKTEDDLNFVMQVNFFGPFLLTHLLLEPLKAAEAARIIFVSSITAQLHDLKLENLNLTDYTKTNDNIVGFYKNSKVCNIIAAQEFGRRLKKYGITANSLDPLGVRTQIFRKAFEVLEYGKWRICLTILNALYSMNEIEAAETYLHLASSEKLDNKTGGHYAACRRMYKPRILKDEQFCEQIWKETEKLVKLKDEEKLY